MNTDENLIKKLQALLRLSESANQHEAELALQRAQALAIKHKVELASINAHGDPAAGKTSKIERVMSERKKTMAHKYIDWIVSKHFGVKFVYLDLVRRDKVWVLGTPADIEFAKWVWEFLNHEFPRLFKKAAAVNGWPQDSAHLGIRTNYFLGLYHGLNQKLTDAKAQAEREAVAQVAADAPNAGGEFQLAQCYALAIRDQAAAMEKATADFFPDAKTSKAKKVKIKNGEALRQGQHDGRQINLNRPLTNGATAAGQLAA